jgi:hypothetical protein
MPSARQRGRREAVQGVFHAWKALRFDAEHAHVGACLFDRTSHACNQATAAHGHDDGLQIGHVGEQLETDCALPRHYQWVLERVHVDQSTFDADQGGALRGVVVARAVQNHSCTEAARSRDLDQRSRLGHHHRYCDSEARAVASDGLSVIARARSDYPARALFGRERLQTVTSATLFERAREL